MSAPIWQLNALWAGLRMTGLAARADLAHPEDGLTEVSVGGRSWQAARLLGIPLVPPFSALSAPLTESNVRGSDLAATYEAAHSRCLRVDGLWRATASAPGDKFLAAVDLVLSVRTSLAESQPELTARSIVSASEAWWLAANHPIDCRPLAPAADVPMLLRPEDGAACLLFRHPGMSVSYCEMVHPADFQHDELFGGKPGSSAFCITHRLFRTTLEKGVMLRARVRGIFVPRIDDARIAAECHAAFAESDPLLAF